MKRKECVVCCERVYINQFPKIPHAGAEEHGSDVCFKCWEKHIHSEIEAKEWDQMSCAQCSHPMTEPEIKKLNNTFVGKIYDQWLDKAAKAYRERDEEYRECPSATCSYGYFHSTKEDGNIFRCELCLARYCVLCEVPMHDGMTCQQYRDQQESAAKRKREMEDEEDRSAKKVKQISKLCPNCHVKIQKTAGCDHMTCSRCRHEFCWICFADYSGVEGIFRVGNSAHRESCRYHTRRLP